MNEIKCKDYYILKIRYYGSDYYMKNYNNGNIKAVKNHHKAIKNHNDFFWEFIEKITNKTQEDWLNQFYYYNRECIVEEIHDTLGIIIVDEEGYYKYFLPKNDNNFDLLIWMKENCKNKNKQLQKSNTFWLKKKPQTSYRETARELRIENKK